MPSRGQRWRRDERRRPPDDRARDPATGGELRLGQGEEASSATRGVDPSVARAPATQRVSCGDSRGPSSRPKEREGTEGENAAPGGPRALRVLARGIGEGAPTDSVRARWPPAE